MNLRMMELNPRPDAPDDRTRFWPYVALALAAAAVTAAVASAEPSVRRTSATRLRAGAAERGRMLEECERRAGRAFCLAWLGLPASPPAPAPAVLQASPAGSVDALRDAPASAPPGGPAFAGPSRMATAPVGDSARGGITGRGGPPASGTSSPATATTKGSACIDAPEWYSLHQIGSANIRAPEGPAPASFGGYDAEWRYGYRAAYDFMRGPRRDVIACQLSLEDNRACLQSHFKGGVAPGPSAQWRHDWRSSPYFSAGMFPPRSPLMLAQKTKFWLPAGTASFLLEFYLPKEVGAPAPARRYAVLRLGRPPTPEELRAPAGASAPVDDLGALAVGEAVGRLHDGGGLLAFSGPHLSSSDAGAPTAPLRKGAWLYAYLSGPHYVTRLTTLVGKDAFASEYRALSFTDDGDPRCGD